MKKELTFWLIVFVVGGLTLNWMSYENSQPLNWAASDHDVLQVSDRNKCVKGTMVGGKKDICDVMRKVSLLEPSAYEKYGWSSILDSRHCLLSPNRWLNRDLRDIHHWCQRPEQERMRQARIAIDILLERKVLDR
ncbi:MAG: hypothetical protein LBE62_11555 [Azonexus sp.]|jgi:hypothetical protein|nr:hypothetical protein [Azonexus sp.]